MIKLFTICAKIVWPQLVLVFRRCWSYFAQQPRAGLDFLLARRKRFPNPYQMVEALTSIAPMPL